MQRSRAAATAPALAAGLLTTLLVLGVAQGDTLRTLGVLLPPFLRNNFDELVKTAADTCEILPLEILYSRQRSLEIPLLDLIVFSRSGQRSHRLSQAHKFIKYRPSQTLVLYVAGWWNAPFDESSKALIKALLTKHRRVLVVNTQLSFSRGYVSSASRVNPIANQIADLIINLEHRVPLSSIHLIGFSLGAHVAGITGKLVQQKLGSKIGRITALDPAKPCFLKASDYRLGKDDADFVQVVHSSSGVLGLEQPLGHVDVYMNGVDVKQPECLDRGITLECDHAQAWRMYSASVTDESALMSRRCEDWEELMSADCRGNLTVMGYSCSDQNRGLYLYKSDVRNKRMDSKPQVFNLFEPRTWFAVQT
ncbi:hypothetical protein ACJJTC_012836 [Scirpophaga incertulas]